MFLNILLVFEMIGITLNTIDVYFKIGNNNIILIIKVKLF